MVSVHYVITCINIEKVTLCVCRSVFVMLTTGPASSLDIHSAPDAAMSTLIQTSQADRCVERTITPQSLLIGRLSHFPLTRLSICIKSAFRILVRLVIQVLSEA